MSAPATPAPVPKYLLKCVCTTCGAVVYDLETTHEPEAKQGYAKMITAGELHDCKSGPKK